MNQTRHPVHPDISEEMWGKINKIIANGKGKPGSVIAVLRESQEVVGYLPAELIRHISQGLVLPTSQVFGVVTFYSLFSLTPKGKYVIGICLGTACYVKGSQQVMDKFAEILKIKPGETTEDGLFTLDALRCIGACGIAPALSINGKVYPKVVLNQVAKIINDLRKKETESA